MRTTTTTKGASSTKGTTRGVNKTVTFSKNMNNAHKAFCTTLINLRTKAALSQKELGGKVKYKGASAGQFIHNVESGKAFIPVTRIKSWAKAVGFSPKKLLVTQSEVQYQYNLKLANI